MAQGRRRRSRGTAPPRRPGHEHEGAGLGVPDRWIGLEDVGVEVRSQRGEAGPPRRRRPDGPRGRAPRASSRMAGSRGGRSLEARTTCRGRGPGSGRRSPPGPTGFVFRAKRVSLPSSRTDQGLRRWGDGGGWGVRSSKTETHRAIGSDASRAAEVAAGIQSRMTGGGLAASEGCRAPRGRAGLAPGRARAKTPALTGQGGRCSRPTVIEKSPGGSRPSRASGDGVRDPALGDGVDRASRPSGAASRVKVAPPSPQGSISVGTLRREVVEPGGRQSRQGPALRAWP